VTGEATDMVWSGRKGERENVTATKPRTNRKDIYKTKDERRSVDLQYLSLWGLMQMLSVRGMRY